MFERIKEFGTHESGQEALEQIHTDQCARASMISVVEEVLTLQQHTGPIRYCYERWDSLRTVVTNIRRELDTLTSYPLESMTRIDEFIGSFMGAIGVNSNNWDDAQNGFGEICEQFPPEKILDGTLRNNDDKLLRWGRVVKKPSIWRTHLGDLCRLARHPKISRPFVSVPALDLARYYVPRPGQKYFKEGVTIEEPLKEFTLIREVVLPALERARADFYTRASEELLREIRDADGQIDRWMQDLDFIDGEITPHEQTRLEELANEKLRDAEALLAYDERLIGAINTLRAQICDLSHPVLSAVRPLELDSTWVENLGRALSTDLQGHRVKIGDFPPHLARFLKAAGIKTHLLGEDDPKAVDITEAVIQRVYQESPYPSRGDVARLADRISTQLADVVTILRDTPAKVQSTLSLPNAPSALLAS